MMRVHVQSALPCSEQQAWEAIQTTALLMEVTPGAAPQAVLEPRPLPARWTDVPRLVLRVPGLGLRTIEVLRVDAAARIIQTRERDSLVSRWDHTMRVERSGDGGALYADTVEIEAGLFTVPIYVLAQLLYRYRHRGWRRIARRLAAEANAKVAAPASRLRDGD